MAFKNQALYLRMMYVLLVSIASCNFTKTSCVPVFKFGKIFLNLDPFGNDGWLSFARKFDGVQLCVLFYARVLSQLLFHPEYSKDRFRLQPSIFIRGGGAVVSKVVRVISYFYLYRSWNSTDSMLTEIVQLIGHLWLKKTSEIFRKKY